MNLRNIEFLIEEAFTGIWRNGLMAFASISTIALSIGVLGAFVLLALGANNFMSAQVKQQQLAVFVDLKAGQDRADEVAKQIREMPGVSEVEMRDRDKAWEDFKIHQPGIASAGISRNVLPYTLDVKVAKGDDLPGLAQQIRQIKDVHNVAGRSMYEKVIAIVHAVRVISLIGVLVLLITTSFIISNAIRLTLYARRREIRIMQLVGATNQTIKIPLIIEGMVFGALGALVALVLLRLGGTYLAISARQQMPVFGQFSSDLSTGTLAMWLMIMGVVMGAIGSMVSIRRFLKD